MQKFAVTLILFCFSFISTHSQTTDLAIVVSAQNTSGNPISQVNIYEEFQYLVTIINSGEATSNATFSQTIDTNLFYLSATSQNTSGGATLVSNLDFSANTVSGTIVNMPSNSSVEVLVLVKAPLNPGGIATSTIITPANGIMDVNTNNNQSIISIDVNDLPIDFTVTHSQISPPSGTTISSWNETITYNFTITNNSAIDFPISNFSGIMALESNLNYGKPVIQLESLTCIGGTNGMTCPTLSTITSAPITVATEESIFTYPSSIDFTSGSSLTFQIVYKFLDPICGIEFLPLEINSFISIVLDHNNNSSNNSNEVTTPLIEADLCPTTDLCIETIQVNPVATANVNWNQQVTFNTIVCNNGPSDALMRFFVQNLSINIEWDIISITCNSTTGNITCNDFSLIDQDQFWQSNEFILPANTTINLTFIVIFLETDLCEINNTNNALAHVRSAVNLLSPNLIDSNTANNGESDFVILPALPICDPNDLIDLQITKTQISPALPEGESEFNTTNWGNVTYEIVATNPSIIDAVVSIEDYMPNGENLLASATLVSVDCVSTTGSANCIMVTNTNEGVLLDGEPQMGIEDLFWSILPEEQFILPGQSSVTFHVVVNWQPECSEAAIPATNGVRIESVDGITDSTPENNSNKVVTYFAPCVDLIVQTYPELTPVTVNQNFNWIIDITNSNTSSNATNINFETILDPEFTITGASSCTVINGNATCANLSIINGNTLIGLLPNMDAASSIQIIIPVSAPGFGGAFTNTALAIPDANDNQEITPETNTSISNVQVIAPTINKNFTPNEILAGQQSILQFTINNLTGNPAQEAIAFIDNLPNGLTLAGSILWVENNGCSAIFIGNLGDTTVTVLDLTIPDGVASCTFSVPVTATVIGDYLNNSFNFTNVNNLDPSQASATLNVIENNTNTDVDIEVLKNVIPTNSSIGEQVVFTITTTNIGTTEATNIVLHENLPESYNYISSNTSSGLYDNMTFLWTLSSLNPNQSETLTITAQVNTSNNLLNTVRLQSLSEVDTDNTNNEDSAEVFVNDCLNIPQGFSPNNDGFNDLFEIQCIEDYPQNNIKIFNRYGSSVFETNNYTGDWNGIPNQGLLKTNRVVPVGTYYYVLTTNHKIKPLVGWLYIHY